ncbi:MAG: 50S ribosomal protein L2, partial [Erythrobacter sp.]
YKGKPVKSLVEGKRKTGGRNNKGHVTSRGMAGGHKQKYRYVDFKRRKWDVEGTVERLEYDPNRTAFIALVKYDDGELAYILAPQRLAVGDKVIAAEKCDTKPGNAMLLGQMPVGTICHNVEMKPGKGGQIARAAGSYVQLVGRDRGMVIVRLNSGEQRYLRADCMGTVGAVSNPDNQNQNLGKAGRRRWMGIKPLTRGVAKNPVDHPHGGGEGRTSGGRHPVTPWGKPTKGARTRKNKQTDKMIIRSRHAKKKR